LELFVLEGPDRGRSFSLGAQSVIGRDPTAAVNLTDEEVSRRHALIIVGEGQATIEDLGSSNGTFTDAGEVEHELPVGPGDRIRVGQTVLELRTPQPAEDPENLRATKVPLPPLEGV
jgi:pSer/pThr/pTyr-binding forkhead associated (FHA) protein